MSIEAMKQALEALENIDRWLPTIGQRGLRDYEFDAICALRKALDKHPANKPIWYHGVDINGCSRFYHHDEVRPSEFNTPLYTTPQPQREWVGLTDAEIEEFDYDFRDLVMDIEKLLMERNL